MNSHIVLGIETSGLLCSVAWWRDHKILLEYNIEKKNAHATLVGKLVNQGFKKLKLKHQAATMVAVGSGPGSFTGLRIGMSYAKGFCYALDIPLVAVSNFEVLAEQISDKFYPLYTLIEAPREKYYVGLFETSYKKLDHMYLASLSQIEKGLAPNGMVIYHEETLKGHFGQQYKGKSGFFQGNYCAGRICSIGFRKFMNGAQSETEEAEPLYLQPFAGIL
jgi:tRNA threonylcarbamoyladenosine biosynthesis protein TsaB